jgi:hypothetical protein
MNAKQIIAVAVVSTGIVLVLNQFGIIDKVYRFLLTY